MIAEKWADGLYRVEYDSICAGFVVRDGKIKRCAPILRKWIGRKRDWPFWATWICP